MLIPRLVAWISSLGWMLAGAGLTSPQDFPTKPIRIVTGAAGGGSDFAVRLIAPGLAAAVGQQVIVDNRAGTGVIPGEIVAKSPPDGYTMLFYGSAFWLLPYLQDKVPFDPVKDFSPITLAATAPNMLVVHPSVTVTSVKELIAMAKAKPATLNYASGPAGSSGHLSAELFKAMAGVNIVRIGYKGTGPALTDVIGGQVQMMFPNAGGAAPHVKSGRLRALAITSTEPSALFPGLTTVAAAGLPGYESVTLNGLFSAARTPAPVVNRLNQELVRVLNRGDVKEKFAGAGVEVVGSTPQKFAAAVKAEMTVLGKVIRDAGIRED